MPSCSLSESEELVAALIHDLRQPLEVVSNSAEYLRHMLDGAEGPVETQLRIISQQVERAADLLTCAASQLLGTRVSRAANRDFTNSQTAALT